MLQVQEVLEQHLPSLSWRGLSLDVWLISVPIGAIVVVFWLSMGFMTQTLVTFFQDRLVPMIIGG